MQIKIYFKRKMMKKTLSGKTIGNLLFIGVLLMVLFVPSAKAVIMQGLMQVGFFKPDTTVIAKPQPATDFSGVRFKDVSGNVICLGDLKGKVVFLNFWATWCPPCLAELPAIHQMYTQFRKDDSFVFIFVDADSDLQKAGKFIRKRNYHLPLYALASDIPETLFSGSLPTTVVFDKQGRISYHEVGAANYNDTRFITFMTKLGNMK